MVLFLLAVAAVTVAVNLVVAGVYASTVGRYPLVQMDSAGQLSIAHAGVPRHVYALTTLATLAIIALRSLWEIRRLRAGGDVVAVMAGGRLVDRGTTDPDERRLINVVDEMAIASGVTAPHVYVLPGEPGINAFAAGFAPNQATLAVTEGAIRGLRRDELQAVVAHEFSHILNGDMRLNISMIGVLAGILFIGEIGGILMRSRGSRNRSGTGTIVIGLLLTVIGYVGLVGGRLVKAAVSRQREFLADASSVQFTRNPDGLAGALTLIAGQGPGGSLVRTPHAEMLSHMFFARGIAMLFESIFATHPDLAERIRRINPQFVANDYVRARGRFVDRDEPAMPVPASAAAGGPATGSPGVTAAALTAVGDTTTAAAEPASSLSPARGTAPPRPAFTPQPESAPRAPSGPTVRSRPAAASDHGLTVTPSPRRAVAAVLASVGNPAPRHVDYAAQLLASLPAPVRDATYSAADAGALILSFALSPDEVARKQQLTLLEQHAEAGLASAVERLARQVATLAATARLPVVTLAVPTLASLSQGVKNALVQNLERLVDADQRVTLHEFVLLTIVRHQLRPEAARAVPVAYRSIVDVADDARLVLSLLAHAGEADTDSAFARGLGVLDLPQAPAVPLDRIVFARVAFALDRLRQLAPFVKRLVIAACIETATSDERIALGEAELMRAVATALDCPVPPVLDAAPPDAR